METTVELSSWLTNALEALALPARNWLNKLDSVRAVWAVRRAVAKGIIALEGTSETKNKILEAVEAAFVGRVLEIWENRLESIEIGASNALRRVASLLENSTSGDARNEGAVLNTQLETSDLTWVP
jgi:hypothetical protein